MWYGICSGRQNRMRKCGNNAHTFTHEHAHAHTYMCMYLYIHTCMHTRTHAHTHAHTHLLPCPHVDGHCHHPTQKGDKGQDEDPGDKEPGYLVSQQLDGGLRGEAATQA